VQPLHALPWLHAVLPFFERPDRLPRVDSSVEVRYAGVVVGRGAFRELGDAAFSEAASGSAFVGVPAGAVPSGGRLVHHRFVAADCGRSIVFAGSAVMGCCRVFALTAALSCAATPIRWVQSPNLTRYN